MLSKIIFLSIVFSIVLFSTIPCNFAYAQTGESNILKENSNSATLDVTSTITSENNDNGYSLFVPSHMLLSENNQGVIIRNDISDSVIVRLSSNSDIIDIPKSIIIQKGDNHALFDVTLRGIGDDIQIIANIGKSFLQSTTSVTDEIDSSYEIFLAFPENSAASDVLGAIYLVDYFFNPIYMKEDTTVSLVGVGMDAPHSVIIPKGKSHAFFSVDIRGDSTLTAYTVNSISNTIHISYKKPSYSVKINVIPDIMAPHSFGFAATWITDSEGNIIRPPMSIISQIHTSDDNILSVDSTRGSDGRYESQKKIHIRDGFHWQKIFTHEKGTSDVTVSVPGYGTATEKITVDKYDSPKSFADSFDLEKPNAMKAEIFPPVTDSEGYLVLSMFRQITDESEKKDDTITETLYSWDGVQWNLIGKNVPGLDNLGSVYSNGTTKDIPQIPGISSSDNVRYHKDGYGVIDAIVTSIPEDDDSYYPLHGIEKTKFHLASQNLSHDSLVEFFPDGMPSQSIIIPIYGSDIGEHDIYISSAGLPVATANVTVADPIKYNIHLMSLPPINPDETRPLFLISVVDSHGVIVDPHYTFGDLHVNLISSVIEFESDSMRLSKPVSVIYGKSNVDYPRITIIAQNENIVSTHHTTPQQSHSIEIQMPESVHAGEEFPIFAYLVAENKVVSLVNDYLESDCTGTTKYLFVCDGSSHFTILDKSIGFAKKPINVFENKFDDASSWVDFGDDILYVGGIHTIPSDVPDGVSVKIYTEIPHKYDDNDIILNPDYSGIHDVAVVFESPGYATETIHKVFTVNNEVQVMIHAVDGAGSALSGADMTYGVDALKTSIPANIIIPRNTIHFEFAPSFDVGTASYQFESVLVKEQSYDERIIDVAIFDPTDVIVQYKNIISIRLPRNHQPN